MRPPEELENVDWSALKNGYAVPSLARMMYMDPADVDIDEYWDHHFSILNLGEVYEASAAAAPFLAHAALHSEHYTYQALALLADLANRPDDADEIDVQVRDAVAAQAQELLPCLESPDLDIKRLALRALGSGGSLGAERPVIAGAVLDMFTCEPNTDVAADALTALETLGDANTYADLVEFALNEPEPVLRLTGLLCALETGLVRDIREREDFVDEARKLAARWDRRDMRTPFPGLGTRTERAERQRQALQLLYRYGP